MNDSIIRSMSSQLSARIRQRILMGTYPPGSVLLQDSLASEFGTSKIPVREALVQLRSEGLIDIYAHRGFRVRPLSASEVEEVFRLRLQIEPQVVSAGALRAQPADQAVTRSALAALNEAFARKDLQLAADLNCAFHISMTVPRLQPVAADILTRLHTLSQRYVRMHLLPSGRIKRATKEHAALHEAWQARKSKEAGRLTFAHIEETREELTTWLKSSTTADC